jgi:hypothetical protein
MLACQNPLNTNDRETHAPVLKVYEPHTPGRAVVEEFIQTIYAERYGARVPSFAPVLLALESADGKTLAAVGYRSAANEQLFLEHYLNQPVEQALFGSAAQAQQRQHVVEVAHLVAIKPGAGRLMMVELGKWLRKLGAEWAVSTVTRELRHLFIRMGIAPLALGAASPERLGDEARCWGEYYSHDPVVLGIALGHTLKLRPKLVGGA